MRMHATKVLREEVLATEVLGSFLGAGGLVKAHTQTMLILLLVAAVNIAAPVVQAKVQTVARVLKVNRVRGRDCANVSTSEKLSKIFA